MATSDSMAFLQDLVRRRSGIVLEDSKDYLVDCRLSPIAREEGLGDIDELVARLRRDPESTLAQRVTEAMTTNETLFFRDGHPFEALKSRFVPELVRARAAGRTLCIWSAAAATGQEPYSIAMTLLESFPELSGWDVRILATDLNAAVLDRARDARYRALEINRGLPAAYLDKYFTRRGGDWELSPLVRSMVEFRQLNLVEPWAGVPACDLVFMRNVLIYFDANTRRSILTRLRHVLMPDGFLVLGSAETPANLEDAYAQVRVGTGVYYRPKASSSSSRIPHVA